MQVLLRVVKGERFGRTWLLPTGDYVIGRSPSCQIQLKEYAVSRHHCRLRVTKEGLSICDLGSRNKTGVTNYWVTDERPLKDGDSIFVCSTSFQVQLFNGDLLNLSDLVHLPCDETDDFGPVAHEDLLAAAGLNRAVYLALIEQARLTGSQ